jgi:hypothetical protein
MRASTCFGSLALLATTVFGLGACNEEMDGIDDPRAISYTVIAQGAGTGSAGGAQYRLVESQTELDSLFYSVGQHSGAAPPVVDFSREVAYFATLGSSPSTGYGIAVERLRHTGGGSSANQALEVDIKVTRPGRGCVNATVITAPYTIISFSREALNRGVVNVHVTEAATNCGSI